MDQVFNDLSLSGIHTEKEQALKALNDVYLASKEFYKMGFTRTIRTTKAFGTRELAQGYTYNSFLQGKELPREFRELRSALLSQWSKSPYVEELLETEGMTELQEYTYNSEPCLGLALAHMWDIPALSLAGEVYFNSSIITINKSSLQDDETIINENCCITLIKCKADITSDVTKQVFPMDSGMDLALQANKIYYSIELSPKAKNQLESFKKGSIHLYKIKNILKKLHEAMLVAHSAQSPFEPKGLGYASGESETVRNNSEMSNKRTFVFDDGVTRVCMPHVRIDGNYRIHLLPDTTQGKVYIGYVGPHLPTATVKG